MFTPPDTKARALSNLARQLYEAPAQLEELRRLATNSHHIRLFLSGIADAAWLDALYEAGLIQLPRSGEPWPVDSLVGGLGRTDPQAVADLLGRLLDDTKNIDKDMRLGGRFEILRVASELGAAGHSVATEVLKLHGPERWVGVVGVRIAQAAEPADPVVTAVADAVIGSERQVDGGRQSIVLLDRLESGLNADNAAERIQLVAAKTRRLAIAARAKHVFLDMAAMTTVVDGKQEVVVVLAHHLVRLAARARDLGVATAQLRDWASGIPDDLGERIVCQLFAGATDVPLQDKIDHVTVRLASRTATGDDRDLVNDIMSSNPPPEQLKVWITAIGDPSLALDDSAGTRQVPDDLVRVWRWSIVLPADMLTGWREPIAMVTAQYGEPSASELDTRMDRAWSYNGQSAHSAAELSALPALEAAVMISRWRPDAQSRWNLVSARELARTLEIVVKEDPRGWTGEPTAVVEALREPVYVLHYVRALASIASELPERAPAILDAMRLVRDARWEPEPIGADDYDYEPDWDGVDTAVVDLVAAIANDEGHLAGHLDEAWDWALKPTREHPSDGELNDPVGENDALASAINRPWGRGLEAILALAGWEFRNPGQIRPDFEEILDELIRVPGVVGLEFRAVLSSRRPFLETVVPTWLDTNADLIRHRCYWDCHIRSDSQVVPPIRVVSQPISERAPWCRTPRS